MRKLIYVFLLLPVMAFSQKTEKIPYASYDFLKLVNKHYKEIQVLEEGVKSVDSEGKNFWDLVDSKGQHYSLYAGNVLKLVLKDGFQDFYYVDKKVCSFRVLDQSNGKWVSFFVNGAMKESYIDR